MTATPVLHIKRRFGIYVINSSKTIRRREAPGCLHACSQLNAEKLEAEVHPKLHAPVLQTTPSNLPEDTLLHFQTCVEWQSPGSTGGPAICTPLLGGTHICERILSDLMPPVWKEEAPIQTRPHRAHGHRRVTPRTQGSVQRSSRRFSHCLPFRLPKVLFLFSVFYKVLHTPTFSYK